MVQKPSALIKPTLDTTYHIDYSWWDRNDDLRTYLLSHLPPEQRERISGSTEQRIVDFVDPDSGEVSQLDELQLAIQMAARDPDFINPHTSVVDSIFRVFLANGNKPLSSVALGDAIGRPAQTILKTVSGARVYKGIRPVES
jgi:hypothetical protein